MKVSVMFFAALLAVLNGADAFAPSSVGLRLHSGQRVSAMAQGPSLRTGRSLSLKMSETETKEETKAAAAPETAKEEPPKENMMTKVKAAGVAGLVSYALWEFVFWTVSVPVAIYSYHATTGEWPSFDNPESTAKVSAVIFGFLNVARALVPVRIALTLGTAPLVDKYIIKPFNLDKKKEDGADSA